MANLAFLSLVEHGEADHEFEVAPGTTEAQLKKRHDQCHKGDTEHLNHDHRSGEVVYR
jgi:hypothetical protein